MSENIQNNEPQKPTFNIQRIYLKDISLEQPNSPKIFLEKDNPNIEVSIDINSETLSEEIFEVCVTSTITAKIDEKTSFLIECKQAGIFEIQNISKKQLDPVLGITCPTIIYPYLRSNIADLITRAGFPPIHLTEINFELFYNQRKEAKAKNNNQELKH
tara:strand:- start:503 stop:979 length:477 start_codon:yes stop_codon:yes gene_type:complete